MEGIRTCNSLGNGKLEGVEGCREWEAAWSVRLE